MAQYAMRWGSRNVLVLRQNDELGMARRLLEVQPWGIRRLLWRPLLGFGERFERRLARAIPRIVAVSEVDAEAFRRLSPGVEVTVVPNGVDVTQFQPPAAEADEPPTLLFTGSMGYFPNRDAVGFFCADIWPLIRARRPHVRFRVVGTDADQQLAHLASTPGIEILGTVEDMRPVLAGGTVVVVPLRAGSGTRLKILEAMAMGRAIVSTSVGCEGIEVQSGEHLLVADAPKAFAEAVLNLLENPTQRQALGRSARKLVEARYGWDRCVAALEALLNGVASCHG
jgi:glycosyltransferase involved in cell wall biosynthesis